jgi:transposase
VRLISSITTKGMGPSMSIEGSSDTESFGLYIREVLAPRLKSGQIVLMDNLSVHKKSGEVRDLIEEKGCQLWLLPSYSPEMNPIEEAFSKVKNLIRKAKARTLQALFAVSPLGRWRRSASKTPVASSRTAATRHLRTTHYEKRSKELTS